MNKIIVEVSIGELLDKISILEIKQEKIKDPEKLRFISNEHSILKKQLDDNVKSDDKIKDLFQSLKDINAKLWVIEDDKRQCEKDKDFGEKFIKLSRDVHFLNDDRAKIKLEIKQTKIKDPEKLKFINNEHSILKDQLEKNVKSEDKLNNLYQSLKEINRKLWVIEDDKRQCEKDKDFGEKFIKLSRDVHFLNDDRAKIKLEINNHTGSVIKEIKEYTSY